MLGDDITGFFETRYVARTLPTHFHCVAQLLLLLIIHRLLLVRADLASEVAMPTAVTGDPRRHRVSTPPAPILSRILPLPLRLCGLKLPFPSPGVALVAPVVPVVVVHVVVRVPVRDEQPPGDRLPRPSTWQLAAAAELKTAEAKLSLTQKEVERETKKGRGKKGKENFAPKLISLSLLN